MCNMQHATLAHTYSLLGDNHQDQVFLYTFAHTLLVEARFAHSLSGDNHQHADKAYLFLKPLFGEF